MGYHIVLLWYVIYSLYISIKLSISNISVSSMYHFLMVKFRIFSSGSLKYIAQYCYLWSPCCAVSHQNLFLLSYYGSVSVLVTLSLRHNTRHSQLKRKKFILADISVWSAGCKAGQHGRGAWWRRASCSRPLEAVAGYGNLSLMHILCSVVAVLMRISISSALEGLSCTCYVVFFIFTILAGGTW